MNHQGVREARGAQYFPTYADNFAVGYSETGAACFAFSLLPLPLSLSLSLSPCFSCLLTFIYIYIQGFTKNLTMPRERWYGFIKDYEGGT